jgi:hypothetical protein
MRTKSLHTAAFFLFTSFIVISCVKETSLSPQQTEFSSSNNTRSNSKKIYVNNIAQLYAAINDPENDGATLVLSEGTYSLSPAFPKAGRLELRHDMSLVGQQGQTGSVIINVTGLPNASFSLPPTPTVPAGIRTGAIRMGNGTNSIEWITIQNDPTHQLRSLIQTDIVATPVADVRVAHCILKGSNIALNLINRDVVANGRTISADVEENEIRENTLQIFGAGILITNSNEVDDAVIHATLRGNYLHGNRCGLNLVNASTHRSSIEVSSYDDKIEDNGLGVSVSAGFSENLANPALNNSVKFDGYGTTIKNNNGNPAPHLSYPPGGVFGAAGVCVPPFGLPGSVDHNNLEINFHGCTIENNIGNYQINVYGGFSLYPLPTPVGTYNSTILRLFGVSSDATVNAIPSVPAEPAGTNTVAVFRN